MKFAKNVMATHAVLSLTSAVSVSRKCTTQAKWDASVSWAMDFKDSNTLADWSKTKF